MPIVPHNYDEARRLADEARAKAYVRRKLARDLEAAHRAHIRAHLRQYWWQFWRPASPPLTIPFNTAVDRRVASDQEYKGAVSDNQWYIWYATMYAQGEIRDELRQANQPVPTSPPVQRAQTTGLPRRSPPDGGWPIVWED